MKYIKTFGEQLAALLKQHDMNATALANELGMSSATGVFRLLRNQASDKKQREMIAALKERGGLFSDAEVQKLVNSVDVNRLGKRAYKTQKSIEELLFQTQPPERWDAKMAESGQTLQSHLAKLPAKEPLQILCFNCVDSGVLDALEALLRDPQRVIEISHYVCVNDDTRNPALIVNAASRLIFDGRYRLYSASESVNGSDATFFAPCMLYLKIGVGHRAEEAAIYVNGERAAYQVRPPRSVGMFDFVQQCIASMNPAPQLLRAPFGPQTGTPTMLDMFFSAYQMEKKRAYYHIKPDLCSGSFPPDVLLNAIGGSPMLSEEMRAQLDAKLLPLLTARHHNLWDKTQPTYFVCSPTETEAFLKTGVLNDHPVGMRPFTPEERRRIVDDLIDRVSNCAHYHFRFLWEDLRIGRFQFIGYDYLGVVSIKRDTHYDLQKSNDSFFITEPLFLKQYIDYFMKTLLPRHTSRESESLAKLKAMRGEILS